MILTEDEIERVLNHGPWPMTSQPDPSNHLSGSVEGIAFGKKLFSSVELSGDRTLSCATCHPADNWFHDSKPLSTGQEKLDRNTLALLNLQFHRWYGWAGQNDNLWAQSLRPVLDSKEMDLPREDIAGRIETSDLLGGYTTLFGPLDGKPLEDILVNLAKALAAYQETLITGITPFDRFRNALERNDKNSAGMFPEAAQRGFRIFYGSGKCVFCHSGPLFTNGEFHDAGVPYFIEAGRVDSGRFGGLEALDQSPFTLAGEYTDDPMKSGAWAVNNLAFNHRLFGTFRVPGLRQVAKTGPYMHNGSLPNLRDVIDHYSEINMERLHVDGEALLQPLDLSPQEKSDLLAFLNSLTAIEED